MKTLKKSKYLKDSQLRKLIVLTVNKNLRMIRHQLELITSKKEINRSTLYSFDGPFHLLHANVGDLEFLGKNATIPQYFFVVVDLYSSKGYVYLMRSRKQILQKMKLFYDEVKSKSKK